MRKCLRFGLKSISDNWNLPVNPLFHPSSVWLLWFQREVHLCSSAVTLKYLRVHLGGGDNGKVVDPPKCRHMIKQNIILLYNKKNPD